jgi:RimJ/RimL family protein N-acetyltransferase
VSVFAGTRADFPDELSDFPPEPALEPVPMIDRIMTLHLVAERIGAQHLGDLARMYRDERVMATLGGTRSEEESERILRQSVEHWDRHGFGLWVLTDRQDGRFVGRAGLRHVHVGGADEVELAYALMAESWGRGLAAEASEAILALALGEGRLPEVVCFTLPTNLRSRRVMEKLGFRYEREIEHAGLPHLLYRLDARSWRARGQR